MTTPTLIVTRGLPASGKTHYARLWVSAERDRRARVNRDDLRTMLHGRRLGTSEQEAQVTVAAHTATAALLAAGTSVICDDTNLPIRHVRQLWQIATDAGAHFKVMDFTHVPLTVCLTRDVARGPAQVGSEIIRNMHARYLAGKPSPLPLPEEPEQPTPGMVYEAPNGPPTVLVDIDGTMALMNGRSPYDWDRVGEDHPNTDVIRAVVSMAGAGHRVVFVSGRDEICRGITEQWLNLHYPYLWEALHMRPAGDQRPDTTVKAEIFDREIRHRYRVVGVFDDRNQVVRMWRALGLTVFQVAEGNF